MNANQRFERAIGRLYANWDRPLTDLLAVEWVRALGHFPIEDIEDAVTEIIDTRRFFPVIAEVLEVLEGTPEELAEEAWHELHAIVRRYGQHGRPVWPDPLVQTAAFEIYGDWTRLCERLPGPGAGASYAVAAKEFKTTYASVLRESRREGRKERRRLASNEPPQLQGGPWHATKE